MSLTSALHIGASGLLVNQTALEVTGNNLANAATEGYSRQRVNLTPGTPIDQGGGQFIGTGVRVQEIARIVDDALNARLRFATSDYQGALADQNVLSQIEQIHNSLSDGDLSSRMSQFFNSFRELANSPTDPGLRSLVISEGRSLAGYLQGVNDDLVGLRTQIDDSIRSAVSEVDELLTRIGNVNHQIAIAEAGQGGANTLRDERDQLVDELSKFLDITTREQPSGTVDVFSGSTPLVLGTGSRGLDVEFENLDGQLSIKMRVRQDGQVIEPRSGTVGALVNARENDVNAAIATLDEFAGGLIFEVNKVHASGQGETGFGSVVSTYTAADSTVALNDPTNLLPFVPNNGTFSLHTVQQSTGLRQTTQIDIDLDGVGADTTLDDLAAAIDAVANISATVGADGRLNISSDTPDIKFSFSDDSSGALASLGINTFFTGKNATDIDVNQRLIDDVSLLAAGADHVTGDNRTALALSELGSTAVDSLGGLSMQDYWTRHIQDYAIRADSANQSVDASGIIAEGLLTQKQSVSGVSLDEEAVMMLKFQRAFEANARFVAVLDEMTELLFRPLGA